jgi:hypothetical protein
MDTGVLHRRIVYLLHLVLIGGDPSDKTARQMIFVLVKGRKHWAKA